MIGLTQQEQVEFERIKDEMWDYGYETAKEEFGWHPASKLPNMGEEVVTWVNHKDGAITVSRGVYVGWPEEIINKLWWCYPPKEE